MVLGQLKTAVVIIVVQNNEERLKLASVTITNGLENGCKVVISERGWEVSDGLDKVVSALRLF